MYLRVRLGLSTFEQMAVNRMQRPTEKPHTSRILMASLLACYAVA